jgi:hypothetical protein
VRGSSGWIIWRSDLGIPNSLYGTNRLEAARRECHGASHRAGTGRKQTQASANGRQALLATTGTSGKSSQRLRADANSRKRIHANPCLPAKFEPRVGTWRNLRIHKHFLPAGTASASGAPVSHANPDSRVSLASRIRLAITKCLMSDIFERNSVKTANGLLGMVCVRRSVRAIPNHVGRCCLDTWRLLRSHVVRATANQYLP